MPAKSRSFSNNCWVEVLSIFDSFCCLSQKDYKTEGKNGVAWSLPHKHGIWIVALVRDTEGCGSCEWHFWGLSLWWEIPLAQCTLRHERALLCSQWDWSSVCPTNMCWLCLLCYVHPAFVFCQSFSWSSSKSTSSLLSFPVALNSGGGIERAQVTSLHRSCDWEGKQSSGTSLRNLKGKM